MKSFVFFLLCGAGILTATSCQKDSDALGTGEFEYMIFGHFYGKCAGEQCVEVFKLDNEQLFEDTTDVYPGGVNPYEGVYTLLPNEKYLQVKDLLDSFPQQLYAEPEVVIGMPDAGDWGGIYVEMKFKNDPGKSGFWLLDQNESNMTAEYNAFVDLINQKIAIIQE
jgi:hypothetical protein